MSVLIRCVHPYALERMLSEINGIYLVMWTVVNYSLKYTFISYFSYNNDAHLDIY